MHIYVITAYHSCIFLCIIYYYYSQSIKQISYQKIFSISLLGGNCRRSRQSPLWEIVSVTSTYKYSRISLAVAIFRRFSIYFPTIPYPLPPTHTNLIKRTCLLYIYRHHGRWVINFNCCSGLSATITQMASVLWGDKESRQVNSIKNRPIYIYIYI